MNNTDLEIKYAAACVQIEILKSQLTGDLTAAYMRGYSKRDDEVNELKSDMNTLRAMIKIIDKEALTKQTPTKENT